MYRQLINAGLSLSSQQQSYDFFFLSAKRNANLSNLNISHLSPIFERGYRKSGRRRRVGGKITTGCLHREDILLWYCHKNNHITNIKHFDCCGNRRSPALSCLDKQSYTNPKTEIIIQLLHCKVTTFFAPSHSVLKSNINKNWFDIILIY